MDELPWISVTVQVTVVVPTGYVADAWLFVIAETPQLSPVTGTPSVTTAEHTPLSLLTEIFAGAVIVGGVLSATVTLNEQLLVLLCESVNV